MLPLPPPHWPHFCEQSRAAVCGPAEEGFSPLSCLWAACGSPRSRTGTGCPSPQPRCGTWVVLLSRIFSRASTQPSSLSPRTHTPPIHPGAVPMHGATEWANGHLLPLPFLTGWMVLCAPEGAAGPGRATEAAWIPSPSVSAPPLSHPSWVGPRGGEGSTCTLWSAPEGPGWRQSKQGPPGAGRGCPSSTPACQEGSAGEAAAQAPASPPRPLLGGGVAGSQEWLRWACPSAPETLPQSWHQSPHPFSTEATMPLSCPRPLRPLAVPLLLGRAKSCRAREDRAGQQL